MDQPDLSEIHDILNKTQWLLNKKEEDFQQSHNFGWTVEGVMLVIVASSGIIGNVFCIIGFTIKQNKNNFHHLMLGKRIIMI